jgi:hypothetical protein
VLLCWSGGHNNSWRDEQASPTMGSWFEIGVGSWPGAVCIRASPKNPPGQQFDCQCAAPRSCPHRTWKVPPPPSPPPKNRGRGNMHARQKNRLQITQSPCSVHVCVPIVAIQGQTNPRFRVPACRICAVRLGSASLFLKEKFFKTNPGAGIS